MEEIKGEQLRLKRLRTKRRLLSLLTLCFGLPLKQQFQHVVIDCILRSVYVPKKWRNKNFFSILIARRNE